jgi:hypothetical protein
MRDGSEDGDEQGMGYRISYLLASTMFLLWLSLCSCYISATYTQRFTIHDRHHPLKQYNHHALKCLL